MRLHTTRNSPLPRCSILGSSNCVRRIGPRTFTSKLSCNKSPAVPKISISQFCHQALTWIWSSCAPHFQVLHKLQRDWFIWDLMEILGIEHRLSNLQSIKKNLEVLPDDWLTLVGLELIQKTVHSIGKSNLYLNKSYQPWACHQISPKQDDSTWPQCHTSGRSKLGT
jgi:hypothetical protein